MTTTMPIRFHVGLLVALFAAGAAAPQADAGALFAARVERAAAQEALAAVAPPDRFEVVTSRYGGGGAEIDGPYELVLLERSGPNQSGVVRITFRVEEAGVSRGRASASVRGTVHGPALVATRTLQRDVVPGADDVRVEDADLTHLQSPPVRDLTEVAGRVPQRTLAAGRVLESGSLRAAHVVRRGQPVAMVVRHGGLTVVARGQALANAAPGETVEARNVQTGARVFGEAQPDGTLLVLGRVPTPPARRPR